jgi:hypothetical protein
MNLNDAISTFAVRLYQWSKRDFLRELESDCPLMSLIGLNNRTVAGYVSWNRTLSAEDRQALVTALCRRSHANAAQIMGEVLTPQDNYWLRKSNTEAELCAYHLPPLTTADRRLPTFVPVDPDQCLDTLVACISPIMGKIGRRRSSVRCTRKVGEWKVVTELTFLRRDQELFFEYQFIRKDGAPFRSLGPGPFPRTLLMFYGIYATLARVPSEADSGPMAEVMARLAEYFVSQADPLFVGLGIDD